MPPALAACGGAFVLGGCSGPLSVLDPASGPARWVASLWWVMLAGSVLILIGIMTTALYALLRNRRGYGVSERAMLAGGGLAFPLVTLGALMVWSMTWEHGQIPRDGDAPYRIEARGHQFWWEFAYPDAPGGPIYGASEVYVPADRPFEVQVTTEDVIHSFWVPRLGGKMDAIPGHENRLRLAADQPGDYLGRCAEFCGLQHLNMRMVVHAVPTDDLAAQLRRLGDTAPDPAMEGASDFEAHCAECHSVDPRVRGGPGPNLAHVAFRPFLEGGAAAYEESEDLRAWIESHPRKRSAEEAPGLLDLEPEIIDRIVAYLESAS